MNAIALPKEMDRFAGRIMDIDTHEMAPAQAWVETFGPATQEWAEHFMTVDHKGHAANPNTGNIAGFAGDVAPIDANVGDVKGCIAPGAVKPERRLAVMDAMGIGRQLMYPSLVGGFAMILYKDHDNPRMMPGIDGDRLAKAKAHIEIWNDWAVKQAAISDRIRPVGVVYGDTPAEMYERAKRLVDGGLRAVWLFPCGELPGGRSPAHPDHDPMWALFAERDCAATLHISGDGNFWRQRGWNDAPAFEGHTQFVEISRDPWVLSQMHLPFENFTAVMVLGGVFDRHPSLRFGVIECAAHWVGPLMRRLDMWHNAGQVVNNPSADTAYRLPEPPSFYFKRNIRVTPFVFEDVARDIVQYGLEDVLCFSTDYPHVEGGRGALKRFYDNVSPLGEAVTEKFFVANGQLLLPQ